MRRFYQHCNRCGKRMRRFLEDEDGARLYYFCPHCGDRGTFLINMNAWSPGWYEVIASQAVRDGIYTKSGHLRRII